MNREQLNKHWELVKAFKEGAEIQGFNIRTKEWQDVSAPNFYLDIEYRIKPEPKILPFTFEDAEKFVGKVVKKKSGGFVGLIVGCDINDCFTSNGTLNYQYLLDKYTFLDGSPFGKIETI